MVGKRRGKKSALKRAIVKAEKASAIGEETAITAAKVDERQLPPAERDAKTKELREAYKGELGEIMETARRRRERAKPRQLQEILLWEMDQIRHADVKFKSAVNAMTKDVRPALGPEEKLPRFQETASDKRPSHKASRLKVAE
jgi:hypothetical protein